ncbi:uncharacterized protein FFB20_05314 [Fusarium fujikuroi]|nr:uncharacterized protein FFB20_05314 [Fusarium fujikuroi]
MEEFLLRLPARAMANALSRDDLKTITLLNSQLRKAYGDEYFQKLRVSGSQCQVADRLGKFLDQEEHPETFVPKTKIRFLEIHVIAVRVLDPRTARDHRGNFQDTGCIERIAQALKELKNLVVETDLRDVRIIQSSAYSGLHKRKELLLTLLKICGPSKARCIDFDHHPGVSNFLFSVSQTQKQIPALCIGSESDRFVDDHFIPRLEVFDITRFGFRHLQQLAIIMRTTDHLTAPSGRPSIQQGLYHLDHALRTVASMVEYNLRHLRLFAFSISSGFGRRVIYRYEEHENINDIFPSSYGTIQVSFAKSMVTDMMRLLPQLDEMCILPNGEHFYRGKRMLGDGPINVEDHLYLAFPPGMFPLSLEHQLIIKRGDRRLCPLAGDEDDVPVDPGSDFEYYFNDSDSGDDSDSGSS